jgi:hypothetical protein
VRHDPAISPVTHTGIRALRHYAVAVLQNALLPIRRVLDTLAAYGVAVAAGYEDGGADDD